MSREAVEVAFDEVVRETDLAVLFDVGDEEVWIPRSQILDLDEDDQVVSIPEWLAMEKGLI